jgi:hypothetical protein
MGAAFGGWWRGFRGRPLPEDASDRFCAHCPPNDHNFRHALHWYCIKLAYYEFQRNWNRGWFRAWEIIVIFATGSVPVLAAFSVSRSYSALAGAIATVGLALIGLFGWREDYQRFTRTVELLRAEGESWKVRRRPYDRGDPHHRLVENVNRIVGEEVAGWQPKPPDTAGPN